MTKCCKCRRSHPALPVDDHYPLSISEDSSSSTATHKCNKCDRTRAGFLRDDYYPLTLSEEDELTSVNEKFKTSAVRPVLEQNSSKEGYSVLRSSKVVDDTTGYRAKKVIPPKVSDVSEYRDSKTDRRFKNPATRKFYSESCESNSVIDRADYHEEHKQYKRVYEVITSTSSNNSFKSEFHINQASSDKLKRRYGGYVPEYRPEDDMNVNYASVGQYREDLTGAETQDSILPNDTRSHEIEYYDGKETNSTVINDGDTEEPNGSQIPVSSNSLIDIFKGGKPKLNRTSSGSGTPKRSTGRGMKSSDKYADRYNEGSAREMRDGTDALNEYAHQAFEGESGTRATQDAVVNYGPEASTVKSSTSKRTRTRSRRREKARQTVEHDSYVKCDGKVAHLRDDDGDTNLISRGKYKYAQETTSDIPIQSSKEFKTKAEETVGASASQLTQSLEMVKSAELEKAELKDQRYRSNQDATLLTNKKSQANISKKEERFKYAEDGVSGDWRTQVPLARELSAGIADEARKSPSSKFYQPEPQENYGGPRFGAEEGISSELRSRAALARRSSVGVAEEAGLNCPLKPYQPEFGYQPQEKYREATSPSKKKNEADVSMASERLKYADEGVSYELRSRGPLARDANDALVDEAVKHRSSKPYQPEFNDQRYDSNREVLYARISKKNDAEDGVAKDNRSRSKVRELSAALADEAVKLVSSKSCQPEFYDHRQEDYCDATDSSKKRNEGLKYAEDEVAYDSRSQVPKPLRLNAAVADDAVKSVTLTPYQPEFHDQWKENYRDETYPSKKKNEASARTNEAFKYAEEEVGIGLSTQVPKACQVSAPLADEAQKKVSSKPHQPEIRYQRDENYRGNNKNDAGFVANEKLKYAEEKVADDSRTEDSKARRLRAGIAHEAETSVSSQPQPYAIVKSKLQEAAKDQTYVTKGSNDNSILKANARSTLHEEGGTNAYASREYQFHGPTLYEEAGGEKSQASTSRRTNFDGVQFKDQSSGSAVYNNETIGYTSNVKEGVKVSSTSEGQKQMTHHSFSTDGAQVQDPMDRPRGLVKAGEAAAAGASQSNPSDGVSSSTKAEKGQFSSQAWYDVYDDDVTDNVGNPKNDAQISSASKNIQRSALNQTAQVRESYLTQEEAVAANTSSRNQTSHFASRVNHESDAKRSVQIVGEGVVKEPAVQAFPPYHMKAEKASTSMSSSQSSQATLQTLSTYQTEAGEEAGVRFPLQYNQPAQQNSLKIINQVTHSDQRFLNRESTVQSIQHTSEGNVDAWIIPKNKHYRERWVHYWVSKDVKQIDWEAKSENGYVDVYSKNLAL